MSKKLKIENFEENIKAVEGIIGYTFRDKNKLFCALTHPSAVRSASKLNSYQRYEFLGDSLLGGIVAISIFNEYPDLDEGEMTRMKVAMVSGKSLSQTAKDLGLAKYIIFGKSVVNTGNRGLDNALEDVYEALVAAIYLDSGAIESWRFVIRTLLSKNLNNKNLSFIGNPKSILQEHCQVFHKVPEYIVKKEEGPSHDKTFYVDVIVNGMVIGCGVGKSKKEAEIKSAKNALIKISEFYKDDLCS